MKKFVYILIFFNVIISGLVEGQNRNIDSLLSLLKTDKADTNKVKHLYKVCGDYLNISKFDKGLIYGKQALLLAQTLGFKKGISASYNNIGLINKDQGNYPEALKNLFPSLKIREEIKDKKGIANCYNNIGEVYRLQSNYPEALKMYSSSLKIAEEINYQQGIATSFNNIGIVCDKQGNYSEGIKNFTASLKIYEEIKDEYGMAASYNNIAIMYDNQGNNLKAVEMYLASLKIRKEIGDKDGIAACFINLGDICAKLHKTKEAQDYLNKALQLSIEIGSKDDMEGSYAGLVVLDSTMGNYKAAFEHRKLFIIYRDSLNNEETKKKSLQASMQYEFDKKEIATKAEQDKLDAINAEEKKKQQMIIYAVAGLLVLVAVFAVFMFNRFRITNHQKVIIEKQKKMVDEAYEHLHEKNKEVMDSIHYAKRIQTALITSEKYVNNALNRLMKN
jgi:tetratricopeptide (TPR) repeat protein